MARGWESKAVADQIEEEQERSHARHSDEDRSPETVLLLQRLESLRLSRARTLAQLEQATRPAYRQVLERALRALEDEIEETSRQISHSADKPK